jgi:ectoine hydroxylase-related dioxygenase (phytanoyl-CoA dioxygenase family)
MDGMAGVTSVPVRPLEEATASADDASALRAAIDRDGYLFFRRLVPAERVARLRKLILDHANSAAWLDPAVPIEQARARPGLRLGHEQTPAWHALQARAQTSPELWDVGDAPPVHRVLTAVFGRSSFLLLGMNTCRVVTPQSALTSRPHQDAHYIRTAGEFAAVWLPLGDCPTWLGPLAVWPGSHRSGLRPHYGVGIADGGVEIDEEPVWHSADFALGDALVLTQHVIHCGLPNASEHTLRVSVDLRYGFRAADAT